MLKEEQRICHSDTTLGFTFRADQMNHLGLTACHISLSGLKRGGGGGGWGMFTKPVKVPMRVQQYLPLLSRESLAVMIHLLTHQNRNHFLSSLLMPYGGSVRDISLSLKYCYLETRCRAAAQSLFDKLNFVSTAAIRSMHHVLF